MKIGILGAGAFAIALTKTLEEDESNEITLWTKFEEEKNMLNNSRENTKLFPGVKIGDNVFVTTDIKEAIKEKKIIINALPYIALSDAMGSIKEIYKEEQLILSTTKGIDKDTFETATNLIEKYIPNAVTLAISGPSFAIDIANKEKISLMLASKNESAMKVIKELFKRDYITIEETDDITGIQIAGAIKNAIAVGAGILNGMNVSASTMAAYLAKGISDMKSLIVSLHGKQETTYSYAGIGDLLLTCMSDNSRNFTFGKLIGQGFTSKEAIEKMNGKTVEGYNMTKALYNFAKENNITIQIIPLLYEIIFQNLDIKNIKKYV